MRVASALYELMLGVALLFVPWTLLWQGNWFFWLVAGLRPWLESGAVRGAVSGIGAAFVVSATMRLAEIAGGASAPGENRTHG